MRHRFITYVVYLAVALVLVAMPSLIDASRGSVGPEATPQLVPRMAGAIERDEYGREKVYLPGIRPVIREEDYSRSAWIPVAELREIGDHERVLAVVVRPTRLDLGWVVFETHRAVPLNETDLAEVVKNRFRQK